MPKKAGRPLGAQNKVGRDEKEFIKGLLGDTQQQYRNAFIDLANRSDPKSDLYDPKKVASFLNIRAELSKMVVPKPVEIDASNLASDFKELFDYCSKWDDED